MSDDCLLTDTFLRDKILDVVKASQPWNSSKRHPPLKGNDLVLIFFGREIWL